MSGIDPQRDGFYRFCNRKPLQPDRRDARLRIHVDTYEEIRPSAPPDTPAPPPGPEYPIQPGYDAACNADREASFAPNTQSGSYGPDPRSLEDLLLRGAAHASPGAPPEPSPGEPRYEDSMMSPELFDGLMGQAVADPMREAAAEIDAAISQVADSAAAMPEEQAFDQAMAQMNEPFLKPSPM